VTWKSRPMQDLLGFELDDLTLEGLAQNMPRDEAERAATNLERALGLPDGEIHETTYRVDGGDIEKLPLRNAIRGIPTDNVELMAKTATFPNGIYLMTTGRPVRDREGVVRGGVVTLSDVTALRHAQHRLAELAITDELTRLPNRRKFSVAIVDIDHFKKVNDTYGHAMVTTC
jgi:PAS domain-containing protein